MHSSFHCSILLVIDYITLLHIHMRSLFVLMDLLIIQIVLKLSIYNRKQGKTKYRTKKEEINYYNTTIFHNTLSYYY